MSNPRKVLFPQAGHTKLDLVRYYLAVADGALRGAGGRPNVLVRYPNGIDGEFFFQKRAPESRPPWIEVVVAAVSVRPHRRGGRAARRGHARVDGQPRLPRAAPASGARRRSRSSRRAARRSGSRARRRVGRPARGRARRARHARRLRAGRLAEDVGLARHARLRANRTDAGPSTRCAARRSRSRARSSGARRSWRRASGGRRSATASSSTTTRTRRTARSPAPTRCGRRPTRASRRRSRGTRSTRASPATSRSRRCRRDSLPSATVTPASTRIAARSTACSSSPRVTSARDRATRRGRRSTASRQASRRACSRRAAACRAVPLVEIGRAALKEDALAGLERWRARHPEAAAHLAASRRARRRDARPVPHVDADPREPAARAGRAAAVAGGARSGRRAERVGRRQSGRPDAPKTFSSS